LRLKPGKEIIGIFHTFEEDDDYSKLQFTCTIEIKMPSSEVSYGSLSSLISKKMGILNLDDKFFIGVIPNDIGRAT